MQNARWEQAGLALALMRKQHPADAALVEEELKTDGVRTHERREEAGGRAVTATGVYYDDSRKSWVVEYDYRSDRQSHFYSKEGAIRCATANGWTEPQADVLTTLRAEVEALRDEAERMCKSEGSQWDTLFALGARVGTITQVLDLIDKHAREGQ